MYSLTAVSYTHLDVYKRQSQGYAELLESGIVQDKAMQKDFISRIRREAANMSSLINDILMISRLESRKAVLSYSDVNLALVVDDIVDGLGPVSYTHLMSRNASINSYVFTTKDVGDTETCKNLLDAFLLETFKTDALYQIMANSEMLDSLNEQIAMMSAMLGGIAGISLLVAGVGVMNIMLVLSLIHI